MASSQSPQWNVNNGFPNCFVIPGASGSLKNCVQVNTSSIIAVLVISWILYLVVAYLIYWFLTKYQPTFKFNYWIILLILVVSGFILTLLASLF